MLWIAWILLGLFGLYVLLSGSIRITSNLCLHGRHAHVFGFLLVLAPILQYGLEFLMPLANASMTADEVQSLSAKGAAISWIVTAIAFVYALLSSGSDEEATVEIKEERPFGEAYAKVEPTSETARGGSIDSASAA